MGEIGKIFQRGLWGPLSQSQTALRNRKALVRQHSAADGRFTRLHLHQAGKAAGRHGGLRWAVRAEPVICRGSETKKRQRACIVFLHRFQRDYPWGEPFRARHCNREPESGAGLEKRQGENHAARRAHGRGIRQALYRIYTLYL